jgi:hypothetical protein
MKDGIIHLIDKCAITFEYPFRKLGAQYQFQKADTSNIVIDIQQKEKANMG